MDTKKSEAETDEKSKTTTKRLTVICGANREFLLDADMITVAEVAQRLRAVLNLTEDHKIVLVNGKQTQNPQEYMLAGDEELEFKKPAGQKG